MQRAAAVSLVALAAGVFAAVETQPVAEAASGASPFAGKYVGTVPEGGGWLWTIVVGKNGNVTGSFGPVDIPYVGGTAAGSFKGGILAGGALALDGSWTSKTPWVCWDGCIVDKKPPRWITTTASFSTLGQVTAEEDGDLVGTTPSGATFVWTRQ